MLNKIEKICLIGVGGVGGFFGGMLTKANLDITFVARGTHFEAIKKNGLTLKTPNEIFTIKKIKVVNKIPKKSNYDLVLVCVKAHQNVELKGKLSKIIHKNSIVLSLQNGIDPSEFLKSEVGEKRVLGAFCRILAKKESDGVIVNMGGVEPTIVFGEWNGTITNRLKLLKSLFEKVQITNRISKDIVSAMWRKFIFINTSALTVVCRSNYSDLIKIPKTKKVLWKLIDEVYKLGLAMGVNLNDKTVELTMKAIKAIDKNKTVSLQRDFKNNRESELDFQNGTVVRLAKKYGVKCSINETIYACLLPLQKAIKEKNRNFKYNI